MRVTKEEFIQGLEVIRAYARARSADNSREYETAHYSIQWGAISQLAGILLEGFTLDKGMIEIVLEVTQIKDET